MDQQQVHAAGRRSDINNINDINDKSRGHARVRARVTLCVLSARRVPVSSVPVPVLYPRVVQGGIPGRDLEVATNGRDRPE